MTSEEFSPAHRRRGLVAVSVSATSIGLSMGLTMPLIALILERDGYDNTIIGLNAATGALAMLVVAPVMPRVMATLGTRATLVLGLALAVLALLLMPVLYTLPAWFVLRFALGVGIAVHWVTSETWINMAAEEHNRGRVIGAYITLLAAGFAIGPLLLRFTGIDGFLPFGAGGLLIALAVLPLAFTRGAVPPMRGLARAGLAAAVRAAPLVMAASLLAGITHAALLTLLPVYAVRLGESQETAVLMLSVFLAGSVAMQIPIGWLADRFSRLGVLCVAAAVGAVGALLLPYWLGAGPGLWVMLFLWGGAVIGLYSVAMAMLGQRFGAGALAAASAAFVFSYESGSLMGPVLAGGAMDLAGPQGLPATLAFVFAILAALAFRALRRK